MISWGDGSPHTTLTLPLEQLDYILTQVRSVPHVDFMRIGSREPVMLPMRFTEHGGHAMRKGPDGWWYLIGGNESGITKKHITLPHSPVREPEAGAILRLTPDCTKSEIIAARAALQAAGAPRSGD